MNCTCILISLISNECGIGNSQFIKIVDSTTICTIICVVGESGIFHSNLTGHFYNSQSTYIICKGSVFKDCIGIGSCIDDCIICYSVIFKYCICNVNASAFNNVSAVVICNYTVVHGQFTIVFNKAA